MRFGELLREAMLPAWAVGGGLAAALAGLRLVVPLESLPALLVTTVGSLAAAYGVYYGLFLRPKERRLVRGLLRPG